jgi:carboxymethylenebutenolidase
MAVPGQVAHPETLRTANVIFESDGDSIEAYLAQSLETGRYPGIIVIHEAFGPVEHIRDIARRFANIGFSALAPNLYSRTGAPDPNDRESVFRTLFGLSDAQVVRDLEAAAAYLRGLDGATGKVGCIGFCSGGRQTLLFACSSDKVDAAVDCWGGFMTRATPDKKTTPERPTPVIDLVPFLTCPLFVVVGAEDQNPSPVDADELRRRLEQAHKTATVNVFAGAGHAFLADYRPTYREGPAFELWPQIVSFFETYLR